jgi:hypothetical protein
MTEVLAVVNELSIGVKIGWAVWLVWCVVQFEWYRRALRRPAVPQAVHEAMRRKSSANRRPIARRPDPDTWSATSATYGTNPSSPEFLASLGLGDPRNSSATDQTR